MPHLEVPGASLHWKADGHASAPALLLVHAGIADLRMWDPLVPNLARERLVIRYDVRGAGGTSTADVEFDPRRDALDLLDHLGVERAVVIGCSRGGTLALDLTLEHPERVSGLVAIAPGLAGFDYPALTTEEERRFAQVEALELAGEQEAATIREAELWAVGPDRSAGDVDPEFLAQVRELALAGVGHESEAPRPIELPRPARERLGEIAVPTLVVVGAHDLSESLPVCEYLAAAVSGAELRVLEDAAHLPSLEHPEEFLAVLLPWLERHAL
ncbi:alpha/beta hydrolase [Rathayibacter tritici]|uniref:alpha/beta fold hydrolase n=1 Tax=Rathayibacter tritici TaxID=33888 RepID=UPI000CE90385|nr:alpha/beta fold hydrolase [Rathayibacter tritici]PPF65216.1 alpha/beta hydrolase [Rathayibacter tritici]PPG04822.1 alpha/beta hydrolase [Rathayibacter tritici]